MDTPVKSTYEIAALALEKGMNLHAFSFGRTNKNIEDLSQEEQIKLVREYGELIANLRAAMIRNSD